MNLVSGKGFAPDAALVAFPVNVFLPGSDLTPIRVRKKEFYDALTRWTAREGEGRAGESRVVGVDVPSGMDPRGAIDRLCLENLWSDGLPVVPPTKARVDWILRGSALSRDHVLGKFPPRGAVTTVETAAIALAMAGGRPEYLPILLATVEAFLDPHSDSDALQADSGSVFPVVSVNGPIAKQVRLSCGFGCLGPDPRHPSGGRIGRALRFMQQNLGGALPGTGAMAMFGAMRFTNAVFAEDEEGLPEGWLPHGTERHGYARGTNSISLVFANGVNNIKRRSAIKETPQRDIVQGLHRMADVMRGAQLGCLVGYEHGTAGIMMIPAVVARMMAEQGWTQSSIRQFLWEHSRVPAEHLVRSGSREWIEIQAPRSVDLDPWPIAASPENIVLVVAGGGHPTNAYWLPGCSPQVIGRRIQKPESFDRLLAESENEGPF